MHELNAATTLRTHTMLRTAMGQRINEALEDPNVIEVMVNPDGAIWVERHGDGRVKTDATMAPSEAERVVRVVGSHIGQEVTRDQPVVSAELPGTGERFEGVMPPVTMAPCFAIRKPAARIFTLDEYAASGTMNETQVTALRGAVLSRKNILIIGGTGSGKTTLANALLREVAYTGDRVVILEDTRELQCAAHDKVCLRTQGQSVTMADLVRSTLRLRPDRIIVGEVRGPEALDMLKAWNTGHPGGIATVHANSAIGGLARLEQLVNEISAQTPHALIAEAIDMVVFIRGRGRDRRVETIANVQYHDGVDYQLAPVSEPTCNVVSITGETS